MKQTSLSRMVRKAIFVWFLMIPSSTCTADPCYSSIYVPRSLYRGVNCPARTGKEICDRYLQHTWYKTKDNSTLSTIIPGQFSCNTVHPIWLNGTLPYISDGIVNRTACVDYGRTDTCEEKLDIMIKNCSGFYVYYLTSPSNCEAAYCFGESKTCPPLEPCDIYYHEELRDSDRSAECNANQRSMKCDSTLTNGWYKLIGNGGETTIPTFCPGLQSCGTSYPVWMNDSYPLESEGIVRKEVCVHGNISCCEKTYSIEVKNCSTYSVFNLVKTNSCPERYCFNDDNKICASHQRNLGNFKAVPYHTYTAVLSLVAVIPYIWSV